MTETPQPYGAQSEDPPATIPLAAVEALVEKWRAEVEETVAANGFPCPDDVAVLNCADELQSLTKGAAR